MSLKEFEFIDAATAILAEQRPALEVIEDELVKFFGTIPLKENELMAVSSRIKSENSLKEKIIRNRYMVDYSNPAELISDIPDLIGIRIECKFVKEEEDIFMQIKSYFNRTDDGKYFYSKANKNIRLYLFDRQPLRQKNGFEIYKIDGVYIYGKNSFNFELQIKSMVNVFWGEIDHKILYKNYNYMVTENFFKQIMASLKESLSMIDRQLMILYDHVSSLDAAATISAKAQLKILLSKIIHDVFSNKVREEFGFVFNFNNTTDIIVDYLYMKSVKEKDMSYGENFVDLINSINSIADIDLNLEEYLELDGNPNYFDSFTQSVGETILEVINKDFAWYLFFKIIFVIEEGSDNAKSFEEFLYFLRYKYSLVFFDISEEYNYSTADIMWLEDEVLKKIADKFEENKSIDYILNGAISSLKEYIKDSFDEYDRHITVEELAYLINEKFDKKEAM